LFDLDWQPFTAADGSPQYRAASADATSGFVYALETGAPYPPPHPYNKKILFLIQGALYELSTYHLYVPWYRGEYRAVMGKVYSM
jgi:hypothetical protein